MLSKSISLRLPGRIFGLGFIHKSPLVSLSNSKFFGPYFMYGKMSIDEGGVIEAYYSQKISSRGLLSFSSLFDHFLDSSNRTNSNSNSNSNSSSSQSRSHFQWDFGKLTLASSFCTFGRILGFQFLTNTRTVHLEENEPLIGAWTRTKFGGEVYYTAREGSGGISVGMRLSRIPKDPINRNNHLIFTITGNPLMGHYRSTITTPFISPKISVSSRFDVNINSFDSDLSIGTSYRDDSPLDQGLQFSFGLKNGISFVMQTNLTEIIKIRFGVKTGPIKFANFNSSSNKFKDDFVSDSESIQSSSTSFLPPTASFGLDFAVCN